MVKRGWERGLNVVKLYCRRLLKFGEGELGDTVTIARKRAKELPKKGKSTTKGWKDEVK